MAKKLSLTECRTFNVAIVGLSGTEKDKGVTGVGKSCFCNRFVRPHEDEYSTNHISVISQTDFGGPVVNNDHFLYWGEVTKTADDGTEYTFQVVEQTELIDDSSFQPFKSGKFEPYYKRCANLKLQSSEKFMYICKDQLGLEHEFAQKLLPEGRLTIDGFLCLFDVSTVPQRPPDRQVEFLSLVLSNLLKTKKPVILVTTKQDDSSDNQLKSLEKLLAKKELSKAGLLVVETSAEDNINIDCAFLALAQLMDKTVKTRPKVAPFHDAARALSDRKNTATEAFWHLIRAQILDYKASWASVFRKLKDYEEYRTYVEICGTNNAKKIYRKHVGQLREERVRERMARYLERLEALLSHLLPDLDIIADRSWPSICRWLERQDFFADYFLRSSVDYGVSWRQNEAILDGASGSDPDLRIPWDLMLEQEAEKVYRDHLGALRAEFKRNDLKRQFKQLLEENNNVCAGKSLADVTIFFLGRECFTALSEEDKAEVYAQHEAELRERAKADFLELLLEHAQLFSKFEYQVTAEGLREIDDRLKNEPRCMALRCIPEERKTMMLQHLGFIQSPSKEKCPLGAQCVDHRVDSILSTKARRPQSWSRSTEFLLEAEDNRINLVLLGAQGLADTLAHEIRLQCIEDEYTLDGQIYSLDYRPIDGDVTLPHNSFKTKQFTPHGCFCVYNSVSTLEFIQDSLEKTLLSDLQRDDRLPFQGLPIVIVLAFDPHVSDKQLEHLREEGQSLADRLQCPFIDVPSSMMVDISRRFHSDQISLAMFSLVRCIKHRSSFVNPWQIAESIEPDIRVLMCFMCGDTFDLEFPMAPLLNHQCCYVTTLDRFPTITLETFLDDNKRKVEVTVASYHGGNLVRDELFHGYILVYSAKRKASLANLSAFCNVVNEAPTKVLAVTERGSANAFFSGVELEQNLITEGNALADSLHDNASFMTTPANFMTQTASYTPFFKDCWDRKWDTEASFTFTDDNTSGQTDSQRNERWILERLSNRPKAELPQNIVAKEHFTTFGKNNYQNTSEETEPIYDRPHFPTSCAAHSDSEGENHVTGTSHHNTPHTNRICDTSPYASVPVITTTTNHSHHYPNSTTQHRLRSDSHLLTPSNHGTGTYTGFRGNRTGGFESTDDRSGPPTLPKPGGGVRTGTLPQGRIPSPSPADFQKLMRSSPQHHMTRSADLSPQQHRNVIEMQGDYAQVKDALPGPENEYAEVADALPGGQVHRIRSSMRGAKTANNRHNTAGALVDSTTDSEFSSLEREQSVTGASSNHDNDTSSTQQSLYTRVQRKPTPHKKNRSPNSSAKQRDPESSLPPPPYTSSPHGQQNGGPARSYYTSNITSIGGPMLHGNINKLRSNSPSEGSEGTGEDSLQGGGSKKVKKRRSFKKKKDSVSSLSGVRDTTPLMGGGSGGDGRGQLLTRSDLAGSNLNMAFIEDEVGGGGEQVSPRPDCGDFDEGNDSGKWKNMLGKFIPEKDPEKQRRKKIKEEEKKLRSQQKAAQKSKQAATGSKGGSSGASVSSPLAGNLCDMATSPDNLVPEFVTLCVEYMDREGLTSEGVYRVPGNKAQVELLTDKFIEDSSVDISGLDIPVNAVATALKQFFNELTEPLIPTRVHDQLVQLSGIKELTSRLLALRDLLRTLPAANIQVLGYLLAHLYRVSEHCHVNKMSVENLAVCWWPTILRPHFTDFQALSQVSKYLEEVVKVTLQHHKFIFFDEEIHV